MRRNLISLFTGAGGLDLGLEMAGFTTRVANELEPHACETLRKNKSMIQLSGEALDCFVSEALNQRCYKGMSSADKKKLFSRLHANDKPDFLRETTIVEGDIRQIPSEHFKKCLRGDELFCVAGGPPCQPFSKAGKQQSFDCEKNGDLFFEFIRMVTDLKPKWFVFENVKGLTFTKTDVLYIVCSTCSSISIAPFRVRQNFKAGSVYAESCELCKSSKTTYKIVNELGGSLKIILNEFMKTGYHCDYAILNAADFGAAQIRERLFIVGNNRGKRIRWPIPTHARRDNPDKGQTDLFMQNESNTKTWISIYDALWRSGHPVYGVLDKSRAVLWVKNVVRPHDEPVTWSLDRPAPTIGAHQGPKLALAPNGVPDAQIFRQQWHVKGRRQGDTPPVFVEHQYLSDEELLKLQTFPSWWYLHGTRMQRAFQIGNAVPPILGKVIGEAILFAEENE